MVKLLTELAINDVNELLNNAKDSVKIVCPFLGHGTSIQLASTMNRNQINTKIITRFSRHDFYCKASSLLGLKALADSGATIKAVSNLHTKLYIFDEKYIILGSSNFTRGGLVTNIELNVLIVDEKLITNRAIDYFNELDTSVEDEFLITPAIINEEIRMLDSLGNIANRQFDARSDKGKWLDVKSKTDFIERIVAASDNKSTNPTQSTAWLKFEGFSDERRTKNDAKIDVELNDQAFYRTHFPKKPTGFKNGDVVFIARNSWDLDGNKTPMIYGYGIAKKFQDSNVATDREKEQNENLVRWPYYIFVENFRFISTKLADGISLLDLYNEIGSSTYPGTKNRNSNFVELRKVHSQKDKLRITNEAKEYLLSRLNQIL